MYAPLKKHCWYHRIFSCLLVSFLFTPISLYSQNLSQDPPPTSWEEPFWSQMRQAVNLSHGRDWLLIQQQENILYETMNHLLGYELFSQHFYSKFLNKKYPVQPEEFQEILTGLTKVLNQETPEQLVDFTEKQDFTKEDKIITALVLTYNKSIGVKIFDWISALGLSVNDSLKFGDINGFKISEHPDYSDKVIAVLSHYLAGTGDPKIIAKLFNDTDYEPGHKNYIGENILHSFIRLSSSKALSFQEQQQAAQLLVDNAKNEIHEKDLWNSIPLQTAIAFKNPAILNVLASTDPLMYAKINETPEKQLQNYNNISFYLKDRGARLQNANLKNPLPEANYKLASPYLNFEPLLMNILNELFDQELDRQGLVGPQVQQLERAVSSIFRFLSSSLISAENSRLEMLSRILYQNDFILDQQNKKQMLLAILNKDEDYFKNLTSIKKVLLKETTITDIEKIDLGFQDVFVTDFLLEAIRNSFLPAVKAFFGTYQNDENVLAKEGKSYSLDPLSLAIITYATLPKEHPSKKTAKEIIRVVANNVEDIHETYNSALSFTPIGWAMIFGLIDEVKFLHEDKNAEINNTLSFRYHNNNSMEYEFNLGMIDYTISEGSINLGNYLLEKIEDFERGVNKCKDSIVNYD